MDNPIVSIVVSQSRDEFLPETISSIQAQTFQDCEIVFSAALNRNEAVSKARAEYLAFVSAGQRWHPQKIERQVLLLSGNMEWKWCYCAASGNPSGSVLRSLLLYNFIPSGSVMVRRTVFEATGGFDPSDAHPASQDWELWLRLAAEHSLALVSERSVDSPFELSPEPHLAALKRVVEAAVNRHPEFKDLRSEALAELYIRRGNSYLQAHQREEARLHFAEALTHSPLRSDAYLNWISSFLSSETQQQIHDLRNLSRQVQQAGRKKLQTIERS